MRDAGWPVDTPAEPGATALQWAAFNGNAEMVVRYCNFNPVLELRHAFQYDGIWSSSRSYWRLSLEDL
jgi:ankyrin repeat protein